MFAEKTKQPDPNIESHESLSKTKKQGAQMQPIKVDLTGSKPVASLSRSAMVPNQLLNTLNFTVYSQCELLSSRRGHDQAHSKLLSIVFFILLLLLFFSVSIAARLIIRLLHKPFP